MRTQILTDIDALFLDVRDTISKQLIHEGIIAYRGGAFRSAIISIWIAVAYDIIAKARELATQSDPAARNFINKLDNAIDNQNIRDLQQIEATLLQAANEDLQLFSQHEYDSLQRLKSDRDLCAHPAFVAKEELYYPAPELVRLHLVHSLTHLLNHAPLQGKAAIERFETDFMGNSYPTTSSDIRTFISTKYLNRAKDAFVTNLIQQILTALFSEQRSKFNGKERLLALTLREIATTKPNIYDQVVPSFVAKKFDHVHDDVLLSLCVFIGTDERLWHWLSVPVRMRITNLLKGADINTIRQFYVYDAFVIAELKSVLLINFDSLKEADQTSLIHEFPQSEFIDQAIAIYGRSKSFREAEFLGNTIIIPLASDFTVEQVEKLLRVARLNHQIYLAGGTTEVLDAFFEKTKNHLPSIKRYWQEFLNEMESQNNGERYCYPGIKEKLLLV